MKLYFILFVFVVLCTLHKVACGNDVFFNNSCFFLYNNNHKTSNKHIYNCRYNLERKAIYCEFDVVLNQLLFGGYKKYQYRLKLDSDKIEGNCSLKAGEKFKSATLQTYNKDKKQWGNICLIASYNYLTDNYDEYGIHSMATNYGQQRFVLKTNNCQMNFYYHKKIYFTKVKQTKISNLDEIRSGY